MANPDIRGGLYTKKLTPYTVFLKHTNQKEIAAQVLKRAAKKRLDLLCSKGTCVWRYADIGCGSGELSKILLRDLVTEYPYLAIEGTFAEPSKLLLRRTTDILRQIPRLKLYPFNSSIEDMSSEDLYPQEKNDFLVCIQVLYYVEDWPAQLQKMLESLTLGGRACFVLRSASSQSHQIGDSFLKSINRFDERSMVSEEAEETLASLGVPFISETVTSSVVFPVSEVLEMPLLPNAFTEAGHNIAFDLTRFFTKAKYWHLASQEKLKEIQDFYLSNRQGDKIHLNIQEKYIYCDV